MCCSVPRIETKGQSGRFQGTRLRRVLASTLPVTSFPSTYRQNRLQFSLRLAPIRFSGVEFWYIGAMIEAGEPSLNGFSSSTLPAEVLGLDDCAANLIPSGGCNGFPLA